MGGDLRGESMVMVKVAGNVFNDEFKKAIAAQIHTQQLFWYSIHE